jgi:hypothetical protein
VDWPTAGLAGIGVETGPMIQLALGLFESFLGSGLAAAEDLEARVFEGYLAGLRDVGWSGDWRLARLGHLLGVAIRNGSAPAFGVVLGLDPAMREQYEQARIRSPEEFADRCAVSGRLGLWAADEARKLLPLVG